MGRLMDERKEGQMNRWMEGQTVDRWTDRRMDGRTKDGEKKEGGKEGVRERKDPRQKRRFSNLTRAKQI